MLVTGPIARVMSPTEASDRAPAAFETTIPTSRPFASITGAPTLSRASSGIAVGAGVPPVAPLAGTAPTVLAARSTG